MYILHIHVYIYIYIYTHMYIDYYTKATNEKKRLKR